MLDGLLLRLSRFKIDTYHDMKFKLDAKWLGKEHDDPG